MTSGFQGAPYLRRYDRELVSKPAISLKKVGGATVVRLERYGIEVHFFGSSFEESSLSRASEPPPQNHFFLQEKFDLNSMNYPQAEGNKKSKMLKK